MQLQIVTRPVVGNRASIVEIVAHSVEMAILPRIAMEDVERNRDLVDGRRFGRTGIYMLIGPPAEPLKIYVGSAGDILDRPRDVDHWEKKWWSRAVLIFSDGLQAGQHEQLERLVGRALREAGLEVVEFETRRLPRENPDWPVPQAVRRAVLPAVEAVLHILGVNVEIVDPYEPAS